MLLLVLCHVKRFDAFCVIIIFMTWNEKLKQARTEKGISQQEASVRLQMSRTCYANYEQGTREPSFNALRRICDLYDISADYLLGRTDGY